MFLEKIFKKKYDKFKEGDIFYIENKGKYQLFRLLKKDNKRNIFHVQGFEEKLIIPDKNKISELKVKIFHMPIDKNEFKMQLLLVIVKYQMMIWLDILNI